MDSIIKTLFHAQNIIEKLTLLHSLGLVRLVKIVN